MKLLYLNSHPRHPFIHACFVVWLWIGKRLHYITNRKPKQVGGEFRRWCEKHPIPSLSHDSPEDKDSSQYGC